MIGPGRVTPFSSLGQPSRGLYDSSKPAWLCGSHICAFLLSPSVTGPHQGEHIGILFWEPLKSSLNSRLKKTDCSSVGEHTRSKPSCWTICSVACPESPCLYTCLCVCVTHIHVCRSQRLTSAIFLFFPSHILREGAHRFREADQPILLSVLGFQVHIWLLYGVLEIQTQGPTLLP